MALAYAVHGRTTALSEERITIGFSLLTVEVADTRRAQAHGLSDRDSLEEGRGMLFRFSDAAVRNFWMKDMLFPLDAIWVRDAVVVGFEEHIPISLEGTDVVRFSSVVPADTVIEVPSGWIARHGVHIGDRVDRVSE